jgi:hypothetical protein
MKETTVTKKYDPNRICQECRSELADAAEYHPYSFCVLIKAGQDPERTVREAIPYLKPTKGLRLIRNVPITVADGTRGIVRGR